MRLFKHILRSAVVLAVGLLGLAAVVGVGGWLFSLHWAALAGYAFVLLSVVMGLVEEAISRIDDRSRARWGT